jgi:drug/metabolite transporter (DMT)-like permease
MGLAYGLAAAIGWGTADFLARYATQRIGPFRSLLFMQFVGMAGLSVYVLLSGQLPHLLATTPWQPWAWTLVTSAAGVFFGLALYRAFQTGILSIVSPVTASYAAITVPLSLLSGETLSPRGAFGVIITLLGVILASYAPPGPEERGRARSSALLSPGVGWALLAAGGFGFLWWVFGFQITPKLGSVVPVWLERVIGPCVLLLVARPLGQAITVPRGRIWWLIGVVGVLDTLGFLAAAAGLRSTEVAIVSVFISLFSVVTVLLAFLFLRERLHLSQWLGVGIIFVGVATLSV